MGNRFCFKIHKIQNRGHIAKLRGRSMKMQAKDEGSVFFYFFAYAGFHPESICNTSS